MVFFSNGIRGNAYPAFVCLYIIGAARGPVGAGANPLWREIKIVGLNLGG